MIFITIGTANKGFNRLIQNCDFIAEKYGLTFFAQLGSSSFIPKNIDYKRWLTVDEMKIKYDQADAFIVHGGFGTLSEVLRLKKPIIVVPRTFKNGEAVNDQRDLSFKLEKLGYVKCVTDIEQLENVVLNIQSIPLKEYNLVSDIPLILQDQIQLFKK